MTRHKYCAANWKMNLTPTQGVNFVQDLQSNALMKENTTVIIAPSYVGLTALRNNLTKENIELSSQNFYFEDKGAFTGEISADMLLDCGCKWVILGHSERRHVFGESNSDIRKKFDKALQKGLKPILCIGEKLHERESNLTREILVQQLESALKGLTDCTSDHFIVAYEPVWAIGTGVTATNEMVEEAHEMIRGILSSLGYDGNRISILYGGSVKPSNSGELMSISGVDGFLIGGASLDVSSFYKIYESF